MVQQNVIEEIESDRLAVHVVWMPIQQTDDREAALRARTLIPDPRARHYWSAGRDLGYQFGKVVTLPRGRDLAWDVYFVFAPGVEWGETVPAPTHWAHQLALDDHHLGDGGALRQALESLLGPEVGSPASASPSPPG